MERITRRRFGELTLATLAVLALPGCAPKERGVTDEQYAALVQMYGKEEAGKHENGISMLRRLDRAVYVDDGLWIQGVIEFENVTGKYFERKAWDKDKEEGWHEPVIAEIGLDGVIQGSWNGQPWELEIQPGEIFRLFERDIDGNGQLDLEAWKISMIDELLEDPSGGEWVTIVQR
jgi:hypothetical protein